MITAAAPPPMLATLTTGEGFAALLAEFVAGDAPLVRDSMMVAAPNLLSPGAAAPLPGASDGGMHPPDLDPEPMMSTDPLAALAVANTPALVVTMQPPVDPPVPSATPPIAPPIAWPAAAPVKGRVSGADPITPTGAGLSQGHVLTPGEPATATELPSAEGGPPPRMVGAPPAAESLSAAPPLAAAAPPVPAPTANAASGSTIRPSEPPVTMPTAPAPAQGEPAPEAVAASMAAPALPATFAASRKPGTMRPEAASRAKPEATEPLTPDVPKDIPVVAVKRAEAAPDPEAAPVSKADPITPPVPREVVSVVQPPLAQPELLPVTAGATSAPPAQPAPVAADAAPAPRPIPIAAPARQVAPFAIALSLGPEARLDLTLDPVELGRVEVAIERQGKEAVVTVRAERPETLALLQRDRADLERALSDAGLRNSDGGGPSLSFGLGGESGAREERRTPRQRHTPAPQRADLAPEIIAPRGLIDLAL